MAKHLTDKQIKKIIARYIECGNYSQVAREFNVSVTTVKNHVNSDKKTAKKFKEKKEQNTKDMLAFLESQSDNAQNFVAMALEAIQDPAKLQKASIQTIATAMGIVIDKFLQTKPKDEDEGVIIIWD